MLKVAQLQAFNEVMVTGSISQAARNLHRTQSSVSTTIANVEEELQMRLFERKSGRLRPVPEAEYFHSECIDILRRLDTVTDNMHRLKSLQAGELHIASIPGPSVFFLPSLIAENPTWAENIRTDILSRSAEGVYRLMSVQRYDIGLAEYIPELADDSSLLNTELFEFDCLCAIKSDDPLAKKAVITPHDLTNTSIATLGEEQAVNNEVRNSFYESRLQPRMMHTAQYFLSLFAYVERGVAVAIVDPISAASYRAHGFQSSQVVFKPFEPTVRFRLGLIRPTYRPSSNIAAHFYEQIREALNSISISP